MLRSKSSAVRPGKRHGSAEHLVDSFSKSKAESLSSHRSGSNVSPNLRFSEGGRGWSRLEF